MVCSGEKPTPTAKALEYDVVTTPNSSSTGLGLGDETTDHFRGLQRMVRLGSVAELEKESPTSHALAVEEADTSVTVYSASFLVSGGRLKATHSEPFHLSITWPPEAASSAQTSRVPGIAVTASMP